MYENFLVTISDCFMFFQLDKTYTGLQTLGAETVSVDCSVTCEPQIRNSFIAMCAVGVYELAGRVAFFSGPRVQRYFLSWFNSVFLAQLNDAALFVWSHCVISDAASQPVWWYTGVIIYVVSVEAPTSVYRSFSP